MNIPAAPRLIPLTWKREWPGKAGSTALIESEALTLNGSVSTVGTLS